MLLGWEDPLEEEMATLSSVLAWRIPRTEELGGMGEPGRLPSLGWHSRTQLKGLSSSSLFLWDILIRYS